MDYCPYGSEGSPVPAGRIHEIRPEAVSAERLHVANKDQGLPRPGERHVEPLPVREEPDATLTSPDTRNQDDILLTPLESVNSVDRYPGPCQLLILKIHSTNLWNLVLILFFNIFIIFKVC